METARGEGAGEDEVMAVEEETEATTEDIAGAGVAVIEEDTEEIAEEEVVREDNMMTETEETIVLVEAVAEVAATEAVEVREVAVAASRMVTVNRFDMMRASLSDRKLRSWTTN